MRRSPRGSASSTPTGAQQYAHRAYVTNKSNTSDIDFGTSSDDSPVTVYKPTNDVLAQIGNDEEIGDKNDEEEIDTEGI